MKNTIHHEVKDKIKRGELYSKLPELNRVALRTVFDDFCKDNSIDLSSLWPVFEKSDHKRAYLILEINLCMEIHKKCWDFFHMRMNICNMFWNVLYVAY